MTDDLPFYMYRIFGITLASVVEFPELWPAEESQPDVVLTYGPVPATLAKPRITTPIHQIAGDQWVLNLERQVGIRVMIEQGRRITVSLVRKPIDYDAIRLFLLGWCMGGLLLQRRLLPLHGNAVATAAGAIIFAGTSGAGKSTLTSEFYHRGYSILTDDISAIKWESHPRPIIEPGPPRLKLWANTLDQFSYEVQALRQIRVGVHKYYYPVWDTYCQTAQPVQGIYILEPTSTAQVRMYKIEGIQKLELLGQQLFKLPFRQGRQNWPWLFKSLITLAKTVPVKRVERPIGRFVHRKLADLIETDIPI